MEKRHIVTSFDQDLESIQARIVKMGGLVEAAINDSANSLETGDIELAQKVRESDAAIDHLEREVVHDSAQVIALRAPTAIDLRIVLCAMKVAGNLERAGDYAKNIAKRTTLLADMRSTNESHASLRRMTRAVRLMLTDALDAFVQRDVELAKDVIQRDFEVDQMYNSLFRELLTFMLEDPQNITGSMHLHFIAKNIERIGDHITAICEQVVYLVEGEIPDEEREKGDLTSVQPLEG